MTTEEQPQKDDCETLVENDHDLYRIALYYCYIPVKNISQHITFQEHICTKLKLYGRVRVSHEGINGVLSGHFADLQQYDVLLKRELDTFQSQQKQEKGTAQVSNEDNNKQDDNNDYNYELDMKYCHLRHDLSVATQLFESLSVKQTRDVVSLFEPTSPHVSNQDGGIVKQSSKRYYRRRRRNRKKHEQHDKNHEQHDGGNNNNKDTNQTAIADENDNSKQQQQHQQSQVTQQPKHAPFVKPSNLQDFTPAPHLHPEEWNERILNLIQEGKEQDIVFVDARNVYESRIGHFAVPNATTLLTNTRKYSSLPEVMDAHYQSTLSDKHVFMYCTGGVRCEQASVCLQALAATSSSHKDKENNNTNGDQGEIANDSPAPPPKGIYQLHGGIQRYLERYGTPALEKTTANETDKTKENSSSDLTEKLASTSISSTTTSSADYEENKQQKDDICLYQGKNFVFDPRRTDYYVGRPTDGPIGTCLVCNKPHDDYDNGHCPSENKEARCCRCRVLILVCDECRQTKTICWGETVEEEESSSSTDCKDKKQRIYCGGFEKCIDEGNHPIEQVEVVIPS